MGARPAFRHSTSMGAAPHALTKPCTLSSDVRSHSKEPAAPDAVDTQQVGMEIAG